MVEGPRAPSVRLLFKDARATPALLESLEDTRVGRMPGRVLVGGPDLGEEEMEEVELWAPEEEEGTDISESSKEEDGPGPPPYSMFVSFVFPLFRR